MELRRNRHAACLTNCQTIKRSTTHAAAPSRPLKKTRRLQISSRFMLPFDYGLLPQQQAQEINCCATKQGCEYARAKIGLGPCKLDPAAWRRLKTHDERDFVPACFLMCCRFRGARARANVLLPTQKHARIERHARACKKGRAKSAKSKRYVHGALACWNVYSLKNMSAARCSLKNGSIMARERPCLAAQVAPNLGSA